eukprot:g8292.t1
MPQGAPERDRSSLLPDALRNITRFVARRPRATLWAVVLVACAAVGLTIVTIDFRTKRSDLIDPDAEFHKRWLSYTEKFGDASDIVVVVEGERPEQVTAAIDDLGLRMTRDTEFFRSVLYKIDAGGFPTDKALQFQTPEQLERGLGSLNALRPYLSRGWDGLRIDAMFHRLRVEYESRNLNTPATRRRELIEAQHIATSLSQYLDDPTRFHSPWRDALGPESQYVAPPGEPRFFLNRDGRMGFLKAIPVGNADDFDGTSKPIERLRELIAETSGAHEGIRIGITGIPVLENDEMKRSRADMSKAAGISFIGVGLVLFLGFRGIRHPLLALTMLAVGMAWAFGYTTLVVGHLNILSMSFAVILIGLGIDFAIHYLARYLELRHGGEALRPALLKTSFGVGAGVVTAAITTAFAFFSATFTQFLGVAELGIIAGGGILLCALATFVVLPALVTLADRDVEPKKLPTPFQGMLLRRLTSRFPLSVLIITSLMIGGVGAQIFQLRDGSVEPRIRYDYNLLNLQADGLASVETQQRVFDDADHSLLYAVSIADSPEEARRMKTEFEKLPTVHHVDELASSLPSSPSRQTRLLIQGYRSILSGLPARPPVIASSKPSEIGRTIEQFFVAIRNDRAPLARQIAHTVDDFLNRFEELSLAEQNAFIRGWQQRLSGALHAQLTAMSAMTNTQPVTMQELPESLKSRFISTDGKWLLQIYPKDQIWDVEPLKRFVEDVRTVDANVTGTPLQNLEASRQIKSSYKTAAFYALAVIMLVLLVDFLDRDYTLLTLLSPLAVIAFTVMTLKTRRMDFNPMLLVVTYVAMAVAIAAIFDFRNLRDALLAMIPPVGGGLMMFGILTLLGVDLNPANLIVLPLVLGIGVDDGVHVIHDFRSQRGRYLMSPSTMNAIVLTSLTSMIGFGSMMVAAHRGLYGANIDEIGTLPTGAARRDHPDSQTVPSTASDEVTVPEIPGYEILGVLGQGGMGIVYRALDRQLGRQVAIKMVATGPIIAEKTRERFHAEARAVALLQHPHIAQVFLAETIENRPYFVMEYVDGGPLSRAIEGEPQNPRSAAKLIAKLARAIAFSHSKNVLHRDLKPGNVILTQDGEPKIVDFGLAKFLDGDSSSTKTGDILGTPSYMSPEQAGGVVKNIGAGSDIYSLGAILYELLTGRPPFRTPDPLQTVLVVISDDPVPPRKLQPTVPKDLETICLKCLEKSPGKRYRSAGELAEDLDRYLTDEPILARPVGRIERMLKWTRRRPAWATLIVVCIVGLIAAFTAVVYHNQQVETALEQTETERDRAQRLSEELQTSLTETQAERDRNRRLFDSGHILTKYLTSKHYAVLEALPGGDHPREALTKNLIEHLVRLEKDAKGNVKLLSDLANAYQLIAAVQGNPYTSNRGAKTEAVENYRKALEFRKQLVAMQPGDPSPKRLMLLCRSNLTDIQFQMGKIDDAQKAYTEILDGLERLRREHPKDQRILKATVGILSRLGDVDDAKENHSAALAHYEDALKRATSLNADDAELQKSYATMRNQLHLRMGQLLEQLRRIDEAEQHYLKIHAFSQAATDDGTPNTFSRFEESSALIALGDIKSNRREFAKARELYRQALAIRRRSVSDDPRSDRAKANLALALSRLGTSFHADRSLRPGEAAQKAIVYLDEALKIDEDLANRHQRDIEAVKRLAIIQREVADVLSPTPQLQRAAELYRACIATAEKLKSLQKGSLIAEEFIAESFFGLATIEFSSGEMDYRNKQLEEARAHYRKSLSLMEQCIATWKAYHKRKPNSPRTRQIEASAKQIQKLIADDVKSKL